MKQNTRPTRHIPVFKPRKRDRDASKEVPFGKLIVIYGDHAGKEYRLGPRRILIGRTGQCDIVIDDSSVSREHACIETKHDRFLLQDLKSTNGTQVNGKFIDVHLLSHGDKIRIGNTVLQFLGEK
jgi:pSer/pThr/pTyr-binding forkhead associated (FHA) protein